MPAKPVLDKSYDPKPVEDKWGKFWLDEKLFVAEAPSGRKKFSRALPPPNVTGSLHMGHALCFTLPDIIVRWKRMQGFNTLWLPGTDHASIAVHNVIEKMLDEKGLTREKVGREEFLKIAWDWKAKYGGIITSQLKKLGCSLDWSRERFTMDKGLSGAVRKVFVDLHKEGLIYRGYYLVNHCPHCMTVLSDIEVEHKDHQAKLYYIKYPIADSKDSITVATTRPETMLGDTAIAVHPDDPRFKKLHGARVLLPLTERVIPVITDETVELDFGTGAVKVTPAHDPTDFALGKKHGLPQIIVIDGSGKMTDAAGAVFKGLDRFDARERVLDRLREQGYLVKEEDYEHAVGHCYRCKTVIEPHLSWQWFVKIGPLAKEAIRVVETGEVRFIPANWTKTYYEWMYNIHDWCISRQLWWGHRIPAWYCPDCGEVIVAMDDPASCPRCGGTKLKQDDDVLDTWFSSGLWPFTTLGWPEKTVDLETFYPTDLMSTGFDIIFFWVARMIMLGLKFTGKIPFRHVFINGLVRDMKRRKMSKSEGNSIDPLEMIEKYGTDALRFTLAALAIPGMDLSLSEERMAGYRAFANKIWNASRFVLMNIDEGGAATGGGAPAPRSGTAADKATDETAAEPTLADRWIRSRLAKVIAELNESLEGYRFFEAADKIYHFLWDEFCDWYIELAKPALKAGNTATRATLTEALDQTLRLLHPFMPFITEEIWHQLPGAGKSLVTAAFPEPRPGWEDAGAEAQMKEIQDIVITVRTLRTENKIPPQSKVSLWLKPHDGADTRLIEDNAASAVSLANLSGLSVMKEFPAGKKLLKGMAGAWEIGILLEAAIDTGQERQRLEKELAKLEAEVEKAAGRLGNADFVGRAPREVVEETRAKLEELEKKRDKTKEHLSNILAL
ncbi:MAG: valine--tRNA ligase [Candidatus Aminicenantes bacterium]|nr:valine--tRNA ligase [Candidatus Aminicenantes bacterium]